MKHKWRFRGNNYKFCVKCFKLRTELQSWYMIPCRVSDKKFNEKEIEENIRHHENSLMIKDILQ